VLFRTAVRNMFGPVFVYEVVRLGRRKSTIFLRLLYVLAVMAVLALMYFSWLEDVRYGSRGGFVNPTRQAEFAANFFYVFQVLQFAVVVLLTPATVAGAIADEKERKTLEFLLATDLAGQEIVFGKLAARVMTLLMYVLAGLPVVAFLQLFGGIDPDLLLAGTAGTVVTVVGLAAVSIVFSVNLRKPRDAIVLTYVAVTVYAILSAFVAAFALAMARESPMWGTFGVVGGATVEWSEVMTPLAAVADWVASGNALYTTIQYLESSRGVVTSAGVNAALLKLVSFWAVAAGLLLVVAVTRLRPVALRQSYGVTRRVRRDKQGREIGRWRARPSIGDDPMLWKELFADGSRGSCLGTALSVIVGLMIFAHPFSVVVMVVVLYTPGLRDLLDVRIPPEPITNLFRELPEVANVWCRVVTGVLSTLILLGAAVRGSGVVSGERDRDTWVSLISTPLTVSQMLWGKFFGVVLGQRRLMGALVAVWAISLAVGAVEPVMILVAAATLAVYTSAFAWLGILCSVTARKTLVATVRAILAAAFFGGGYLVVGAFCCVTPMALVAGPRELSGEPFTSFALVIVGLCPPLVMGWLPMQELRGESRDLLFFTGREAEIGPLAPAFGLVLWLTFAALLASWSFGLFAAAANRGDATRPSNPRET
jgi:ABC-type transport system involved in multi-copper enzyme maturation permease subunit